jgi:hypothetical protein
LYSDALAEQSLLNNCCCCCCCCYCVEKKVVLHHLAFLSTIAKIQDTQPSTLEKATTAKVAPPLPAGEEEAMRVDVRAEALTRAKTEQKKKERQRRQTWAQLDALVVDEKSKRQTLLVQEVKLAHRCRSLTATFQVHFLLLLCHTP